MPTPLSILNHWSTLAAFSLQIAGLKDGSLPILSVPARKTSHYGDSQLLIANIRSGQPTQKGLYISYHSRTSWAIIILPRISWAIFISPRMWLIEILKVPNLQNNIAQHNTAMYVVSQSCKLRSSMQEIPLKSSSIAIAGLVPVEVDSAGTVLCYLSMKSS